MGFFEAGPRRVSQFVPVQYKLDVASAPPVSVGLYAYGVIIDIATEMLWGIRAVPHQDRNSLRSEVPIRVAILHEFGHYSRHRAVNDFLHIRRDLELK